MTAPRLMSRSGGRTEANRQAVAQAVLDLLAQGRLAFSTQDVADLSGVHRTTINRRWPSREALLVEAMAEHISRVSIDTRGDWRTIVRRITFALRDFMSDPMENALNRVIPAAQSVELTKLVSEQWGELFRQLSKPLLDAQARGRIREDADVPMIVLGLASTMLTLTAYNARAPSNAIAERIAKQAIRGMTPG